MNVKILITSVLLSAAPVFTSMSVKAETTQNSTQQIKITGTVTDKNGEPLIGVTVQGANTSQATVTDMDGNFTLTVAKGTELTFTYIGYSPVKAKANKSSLTVVMNEDAQVLDEVIATGYGSVSRKNLTTAIVKVKGDDVIKTGVTNMGQMLLGRAAGLQATISSAQPGGGISMTVRGGGQPIYVVDGVVMPTSSLESSSGGSTTVLPSSVNRSGLADINPDDIESIEVLKDASAAIYGVNAANGVILITTKKGSKGRMKVTYDGGLSIVSNYKYLEPMNAQQYMTYVNSNRKELYLYNHQMAPYGPNAYDGGNTDPFTQDEIANASTTNWMDKVLRNGSISSHNITVQGGSDKTTYYLSGNYYKQLGTVIKSDYERYVLRANVSTQLTDFLKLTTTLNYNKNRNGNGFAGGQSNGRGDQAAGILTSALLMPPYVTDVYDENGDYNTLGSLFINPLSYREMTNTSKSEGFYTNIALDVTLIPNWLSGRFLYGYNKENSRRDVFIPSNVYFDLQYRSRGSLQRDDRDNSTLEGTLSFDHSFFKDALTVNAVLGMGRYFENTSGLGISYYDINDVIGNDNISAATGDVSKSSYRTKNEKRSQFGRLNLDLFDRYSVSATLRRDGTDKFFKNKKYSWFPSVAVAWKIFNEDFMKDVKWVNMLKLRASYGVTGNDNLGTSLYGSYSAYGSDIKFSENTSSYTPYYLVSKDYPDVTWEKTVMKNIGLDFSILNNRINGSFDYFWNDITDMLGYANSEGLSMFSTYPINGGHVRRYGWDATINTTNIISHDFRWTSTITLSHYNSIWKERFPNYDYMDYQQRKDEPVNAFYYYETDGIVNASKSNMPSYQPEEYQYPGCPIIKDQNGDGQITVDDVKMKNQVPSLYWGLDNNFTWKNWDLDIFIYSQLGLTKYNYAFDWASHPTTRTSANVATVALNVYNSETNPNGTLAGIANDYATVSLPGGAGTDLNYQNASFVRVRNITLGYTFNAKDLGFLNKYISSIRIYADVQNPFTFTGYDYLDPEVVTGGSYKGGKGEYPMTRTYSLGLKIQF